MEALKVYSLSKLYHDGESYCTVLDHVNLSIEQEEFVSVIGASGSGKTTLLNILGGLDHPTSGSVYVNNIEITNLTEEEQTKFRRSNIGFIFQNYNLLPGINVYENIVFPSKLMHRIIDRSLFMEIVDSLGIEDKLMQLPNELSGGQQQRVAIARAFFTKSAFILADEPTGNLDSTNGRNVLNLMRDMSKRFKQTVIVATHDERISEMADKIILIHDGKVSVKL